MQLDGVSKGKLPDALNHKRSFLISTGLQGVVGSLTSQDLAWLSVSAEMQALASTLNLTRSIKGMVVRGYCIA